ncbi:MAG TPA: hypothetical protein VMW65_13155 [Chloroflexota bacterium]|nr:hypothetical protein [Chloroflexota bacterium]
MPPNILAHGFFDDNEPDGDDSHLARMVRDALIHLHDLPYLQTHPLTRMLLTETEQKRSNHGRLLQQRLLAAIQSLHPGPPGDLKKAPRGYLLLFLRYIEGLSVSTVLARLGISQTQYYREHHQSLAAVLSLLTRTIPRTADAGVDSPAFTPQSRPAAGRGTTAARLASSVPSPVTSLIGREQECVVVTRLLTSSRLLTLIGPGGIGKSRLALHAANGLKGKYPDGIWYADVAAANDRIQLTRTLANVLGISADPDADLFSTLVQRLQVPLALLILDNCSHLINETARCVDGLLRACPGLQAMVTSREALRIDAETRFRVPALSLPDLPLRYGENLGRYEAIQLFVERARRHYPDFTLTEHNARAVLQVCRQLDGNPLAIELAAAQTKVLAVEQIASRLGDHFQMLEVGSRVAHARHQAFGACVEWSYERLTPREQRLFRRLSIFDSEIELRDAEAVCTGDGLEVMDILPTISGLVDKSLLAIDSSKAGRAWYSLLPSHRSYAWDRVVENGEANVLQQRNAAFLRKVVDVSRWHHLESWWRGTQAGYLERRYNDIRIGFLWADATGETDTRWRLGEALWKCWWTRRYLQEGQLWLAQMQVAKTDLQLTYLSDGNGLQTEPETGSDSAGPLATDLANATSPVELLTGKYREWLEKYEITLPMPLLADEIAASQHGSKRNSSNGDPTSAFRVRVAKWRAGWLLLNVGIVASMIGDFAAASAQAEDSLTLFQDIGDSQYSAYSTWVLARTAMHQGNASTAQSHLQQGLWQVQSLNDPFGTILMIEGFAELAAIQGQAERALRLAAGAAVLADRSEITTMPAWHVVLREYLTPARQILGEQQSLAVWLDGRSSMGKILGDIAGLPGYPSDISSMPIYEWLSVQPREPTELSV